MDYLLTISVNKILDLNLHSNLVKLHRHIAVKIKILTNEIIMLLSFHA